ncbi:MAG: DUF4097 domain-containing protein [Anaerolineae bacterium]|nr:DUF4097 domain-containing protein [Anaerolineae bacterium]MCI0608754.1 DUF4097 domain-containing protein [Anaerolineae bacterium]
MKRPISIVLLIVALLLVCAGIAAVVFFTFGQPEFAFVQYVEIASAEESESYASEGVSKLQVQNDAGDVSVVSGEGDEIVVQATKTAWRRTQDEAEKALEKVKYQVTKKGDALVVVYKLEKNRFTQDRPDSIDFVITVPSEMKVSVDSSFGSINLTGTQGDANLNSEFGDISVDTIDGALNVTTQSGIVTATSVNAGNNDVFLESGFGSLVLEKVIAGKLQVESNSGVIELNDVRASSEMTLATQFGDVSFENGSARTLTVTTDSGKVSLISLRVSGTLNVIDKFGNISLEQVSAESYDLDTDSGAIEANGVSNAVKAHSGFGSITIQDGQNAILDLSTNSGTVFYEGTLGSGPHKLHSDFGEIKLSVPSDIALNVDLKTDFGNIKSAIPVNITITENLEANHLVGNLNGGGDQLTVSTNSGNIIIEVLKE